jgi:two-component system sensor histidine kinase RegB
MTASTATPAFSRAAPRVALPWIVRLRYAMAIGQMATVVVVDLILRIDLPIAWICIAPCLVVVSNLWLSTRTTAAGEAERVAESTLIAWVFVLDTLCLTAVLMLTGGPNNPFSLLYLVHITLSATILNRRQTWCLGILACLCFASLFWRYRPIAALEMHPSGNGISLHLVGMWAGFAAASLLVAMFSGKISELLREREESLLRMQEELARRDRLASLVTLAAGAAHELNTPLGTIAVVAKELEHYATSSVRDPAVAQDSLLIRMEVDRCREILRRMSVEGAEPAGEAIERVPVSTLLAVLEKSFPPTAPLHIHTSKDVSAWSLRVPRHAVEQALIAMVKNAIEASGSGTPVQVEVSRTATAIAFEVRDSGAGMSLDSLRHAGEPFFTTKEPGKGMGLGIFLVRTLADRLGGRLHFDSTVGAGTIAVLELPLAPQVMAPKLETEQV